MKNWKQVIVSQTISVLKTLEIIDRSTMQIALVIDENGHLLGTVTDGDIRRALIQGVGLSEPVSKIMQRNFSYVLAGDGRQKALSLMRKNSLHQLPVLDESMNPVGLYIIDELLQCGQRSNSVVLMAGGKGKRLQPLTNHCPKPMLNVGGKPVLESILENFVDQGFTQFYLSVNYKAEIIQNHFGDGSRWGVEIDYLTESKPLGTAGALSMLPKNQEAPIIVMNGDILTKVDFNQLLEFYKENNSYATMCVRGYQEIIPYGIVSIEQNRLTKIEEKPVRQCFVNAGLYVLDPGILFAISPDSFLNMPDLFADLLKKGKSVTAYPIREYWIDIGRIDDYEKASEEYKEVFGHYVD